MLGKNPLENIENTSSESGLASVRVPLERESDRLDHRFHYKVFERAREARGRTAVGGTEAVLHAGIGELLQVLLGHIEKAWILREIGIRSTATASR